MKTILLLFCVSGFALGAIAQPASPALNPPPAAADSDTNIAIESFPPVAPPAAIPTPLTVRTTSVPPTVVGRSVPPRPVPPAAGAVTVAPSAAVAAPALPPAATATPAAPGETTPPSTAAATPPAEETIPAGMLDWEGADLDQVFVAYSKLTGRTVLRPAQLQGGPVKLRTETALTKAEAVQALDTVLALNGVSMLPVGDRFVKAVPKAQAGQEGAPLQRLGAEEYPESGPFVTHVVQTKYFKPGEIMPLLTQFASVGMVNPVVAIDSSQVLVLRDNAENVKRMLELIEEVDVPVPSEFISEVIPIKYAMAADIAAALGSLSSGGAVTSSGSSPATAGRPGATGQAGALGSRGLGMSSLQQPGQPGVNPLGAAGRPGQPTGQPTFTDRLQQIIKRASTTSTGGDILVLGPTKIVADERANSLLVFASRTDMSIITNIVAKLDVVLPQVLIETIIMDVQLGDGYTFGVSYLQHPQQAGDFTGVGAINNIGFFNQDTIGALTNATRGFNYFARFGQDMDVLVQASANDSRVTVVQKPRIMTFHAKPAQFFIGNTVPYVTSTYYGGYGYGGGYPSSQYQQLRVGIQLDVTPYINQDGLVVMEINQQIEEISGSTEIANVGAVPNTASRSLSAQVAVKDGETIILGGFIRSSDTRDKSGVPYLKDIPLLGYLFNKTVQNNERKELLVLMRPTVLSTPELAAAKTADEKLRLPGISEAEAKDRETEERHVERMKRKLGLDQTPPITDPSTDE